jgi:lipooligosaccharide transport system ATP-binding protein
METLITVKNLVKKFNDFNAVDGISFEMQKGECVGILGPNGAGKTTTVRIIQCISPLTSGEVTVLGMPASVDERRIRAALGVVPQDNDLDNDLTVWQNLSLFATLFDIPKKIARERITTWLDFLELSEKKHSRIEELSGGMKRRLLIARALLNDPRIMIFDEPTTGLDPQARHLIWQRIRSLKEKNITVLLNTQYMEEAQQLCDRLIILDKGKVLKEGQPRELVQQEVGQEVVEVRNHGKAATVFPLLTGIPYTAEQVGDTLYLYCAESCDIMKRLADREELSILRRPATLEDVFLKLTGRGLSE